MFFSAGAGGAAFGYAAASQMHEFRWQKACERHAKGPSEAQYAAGCMEAEPVEGALKANELPPPHAAVPMPQPDAYPGGDGEPCGVNREVVLEIG